MQPTANLLPLERAQALSQSRWAYAALLWLAVAMCVSFYARFGFPKPMVSDEFAYLLAAETFAGFALSAPSPPSPESFQSTHVLVEPTHASKYPPGQSLLLTLGIWLGEPALGLALGGCLAALCLLWALRGWVSPLGALLTATVFALCVLACRQWMYWFLGGLPAFASSALVLGFFVRLRSGLPGRLAFLMLGIGASGLLLIRPFEGGLVCLLLLLFFLRPIVSALRDRTQPAIRGALLFAAPLALAIAFQLQLNSAVTGDALRLPYNEYHERHMSLPLLLWQDAQPARELNERLSQVERSMWEPPPWTSRVRVSARASWDVAAQIVSSWFPWLVLLGVPLALLRDWRLPAVLLTLPLLHALSGYLQMPAYHAPFAPLWFLMFAALVEPFVRAAGGRRWLLVVPFGLLLAAAAQPMLEPAPDPKGGARIELLQFLASRPPNLVFVSYADDFSIHLDIVHNDPHFSAHTLFARDLGAAKNCAAARSFPGREFWLARVGKASASGRPISLADLCAAEASR